MTIGDHLDRLIVKAIAILGFPLDAWPADRDVRRAMRGEPVRPEWMNGPVATEVAGIGVGEVCSFPSGLPRQTDEPSPTQPNYDQSDAIAELYAFHGLKWDTPSTIKCTGCRHISHSERRHWRHVTELVTDMVTTDYRIQQLLNK